MTILNNLKSTTLLCVSAAALLAASGCQHASRFSLADAGNGGGIGGGGPGNGDGGDGGDPGNGGGGSGGGGDTGGGGSGGGNGGGSGTGGDGGGGTGGGGSGTGGNGGGGSGGDGGGGNGGDGSGGDGSGSASYSGGIEELAELLVGSGGTLLYSAGNTLASPQIAHLGETLQSEGLGALPVAGGVVQVVVESADGATSPLSQLSVLGQPILGSGDPDSTQLTGIAIASSTASEGTIASVNLLNETGPAASVGVAGSQLASVSVVESGILNPTGEGALLAASVANGDAASVSILPTGLAGADGVESLANIQLAGASLIDGGENAALNLDVLPAGAAGVPSVVDAADLNGLLAPVDAGPLQPVVSVAQSTIDGALGQVDGGMPTPGSLNQLLGDTGDQLAAITVLDAPIVGGDNPEIVPLIGAAALSSSDDAGMLATVNALNANGAAASADIAGGEIASLSVLPDGLDASGQAPQIDSLLNLNIGGDTIVPGGDAAAINLDVLPGTGGSLDSLTDALGGGDLGLTGALTGLGEDPATALGDLTGDLSAGLEGSGIDLTGQLENAGEGPAGALAGVGAGLKSGLGGLFN